MLAWIAAHPACEGVAISAPGYVNPHTGFIEMGGAIRKFDNFAIKRWLEQQTGLPVAIENDANCVLLAERWQGKAAEMSDFLVLTIGTGIGGAIFCNNHWCTARVFAPANSAICRPIVRAPAMCAAIQ
jgi:beta-glucoside kinase